jgi:hypothetical protein
LTAAPLAALCGATSGRSRSRLADLSLPTHHLPRSFSDQALLLRRSGRDCRASPRCSWRPAHPLAGRCRRLDLRDAAGEPRRIGNRHVRRRCRGSAFDRRPSVRTRRVRGRRARSLGGRTDVRSRAADQRGRREQPINRFLSGAGVLGRRRRGARCREFRTARGFPPACLFRRCPACANVTLVKDGVFQCGICGRPLPAEYNVQ